ncbi:MAG: hypothetical protein PVF58_01680 [Candidatus Methanofastidiosia archaeon]|jgi:hypothetical protein
MVIFDCIKEKYCDAIVLNCAEKGCKIDLREIENYIILKGEKICKNRKICDHIIFIGNNSITIVIVEFKSKNAKSSEVEEKLYNCSNYALEILEKYTDGSFTYDFYHYVVVKSWRPPEYRKIVNTRLNIRGRRYNIIPGRLEVSLANSISIFKS